METRHEMLQRSPEGPAHKNHGKEPHQHARQGSAEMKATVHEDQRETHGSQPEMSAHPRLCAADPPDRNLLAQSEQSGAQHECESNRAVDKSESASATRSLWRVDAVRDVDRNCGGQSNSATHEPPAMRVIDQHRLPRSRRWLFQ